MRYYLKVISVLLSVFALALVSFDLSFATEDTEAPAILKFSGKVTSLDNEQSLFEVESATQDESPENQKVVFNVDDNTAIEKDYLEAKLADLAVGDNVDIGYKVDSNGQNTALYITVQKEGQNQVSEE